MIKMHLENIIVIGCGRVGSELAQSISQQGAAVTVMDREASAFDRLPAGFRGRLVQGDALDRETLERAGIATAHGLAAVTSSDSANIVSARIARDIYKVEHVVARVYDPTRAPVYERLDIQTIASSSWGAQRIEQLLLHPGLRSVYTAGNGEVEIYEITVPNHWHGRPLSHFIPAGQAIAVALARGGRAHLPLTDGELHGQDVLQVSATGQGAAALRLRLHPEARE
jgi:trk system potassium uptake protein